MAEIGSNGCTSPAASLSIDAEGPHERHSVHLIQQGALQITKLRPPLDTALLAADHAGGAQHLHRDAQAPLLTDVAEANVTLEPFVKVTTPDPTGLTLNTAGDLDAFLSALITNMALTIVCTVVFMVLRVHYPLMFSNNVITGTAPLKPSEGYFGWFSASLTPTSAEMEQSMGLDQAMLLEFSHLGMKLSAIIGIPMILVMGSCNWALGGHAAGEDHLSYLSLGNVEDGSPLYWVYPFVVWAVCITVKETVFNAQTTFMKRRFHWLRGMADIRANSVLVEGIPKSKQSDKKLLEFFQEVFPGDRVKCAYVAKDTKTLPRLVTERTDMQKSLMQAEAMQKKTGEPQMIWNLLHAAHVEAIPYYQKEIASLEQEIKDVRAELKTSYDNKVGPKGNYCSKGFVTFVERRDAEIALRLDGISHDQDEWVIMNPPEPNDVLWPDMTQDPDLEVGREVLGYALVAGLYFAYMPCVISITNIAKAVSLGPLQSFWEGLAPTLGLQLITSFLPTFIRAIFLSCFTLRAEAWSQHRLQCWYFWFQVVFVVLAAAVGQQAMKFTKALVENPLEIPGMLGKSLPSATHFYMNFFVLQWVTHAMNLMRYVPVFKYVVAKGLYSETEARNMAEPEDQDYYGMGSRCARWTICMLICIVYGTMCPLMYVLCFINFASCRLIYGYLCPYAETKKSDLGGVFWVAQLRHLLMGCVLYAIVMAGVIHRRCGTSAGPTAICIPAAVYAVWAIWRFDTIFNWQNLPYQELLEGEDQDVTKRILVGQYVQPELQDDS